MKTPLVGQMVWWFPGGRANEEPFAAVVTRVGNSSLNLNIFDPFSYNMRIRDGVRHVSEAEASRHEVGEEGAWDWPPFAAPPAPPEPAQAGKK